MFANSRATSLMLRETDNRALDVGHYAGLILASARDGVLPDVPTCPAAGSIAAAARRDGEQAASQARRQLETLLARLHAIPRPEPDAIPLEAERFRIAVDVIKAREATEFDRATLAARAARLALSAYEHDHPAAALWQSGNVRRRLMLYALACVEVLLASIALSQISTSIAGGVVAWVFILSTVALVNLEGGALAGRLFGSPRSAGLKGWLKPIGALFILLLAAGLSGAVGLLRANLTSLEATPPASPTPGATEQDRVVRIQRQQTTGQFRAQTLVNGQAVDMLIDTGASEILLCPEDAQRAGISTGSLSYSVPTTTASGSALVAATTLNSIVVQTISRTDVAAFVAKPYSHCTSLLGMSFLNRLYSYDVSGDVLTLRDSPRPGTPPQLLGSSGSEAPLEAALLVGLELALLAVASAQAFYAARAGAGATYRRLVQATQSTRAAHDRILAKIAAAFAAALAYTSRELSAASEAAVAARRAAEHCSAEITNVAAGLAEIATYLQHAAAGLYRDALLVAMRDPASRLPLATSDLEVPFAALVPLQGVDPQQLAEAEARRADISQQADQSIHFASLVNGTLNLTLVCR